MERTDLFPTGYEPGSAYDCVKIRLVELTHHGKGRDLQDRAAAGKLQLSDMEVLDEDGVAGQGFVGNR